MWMRIVVSAVVLSTGCAHDTSFSKPARTGDVHDFDYFAGGWTTQQHRF